MLKNITGKIEPKGWILEHLKRDKEGITGNLDAICADAKSRIFMDKRVGHKIDGYWSSWWPGETEGNWIIAFIELAVALNDESLIKKASDWVYDCLKYQDEDGYMGIYIPGERYGNSTRNGDLWTQSRLMLAMLSLYGHNEDPQILNALERLADLTVRQYGPLAAGRSFYQIPDEDGSKTHGLVIIDPLITLYEKLGKQEYLDFCEWLYLDFSKYDSKFPTSDLAMKNALDPEIPFVGHGPHTCEQLRIPLLLYAHTQNPVYKAVYTAAVGKIREVSTLSGSCKSDELIGVFQSYIPEEERVGFNMGACIPIPSIGYEYCSTTELFYSYMSGMQILHNKKYADWAEWMVNNAAMAARRPDGKAIQYLCADNGWDATRKKGERWDYSPTHIDAAVCCAPNAGKLMPAHLAHMWQQDTEGNLYAMLYGPCQLKTEDVNILQETNYPFETSVQFHLEMKSSKELSLAFRIPDWSKGALVYVNGELQQELLPHDGGKTIQFVKLCQVFKGGDIVQLDFKACTELRQAADGTFAFSHGPLMYALDIPVVADNYFAYELDGFFDTDYTPKEGAKWDYTLINANVVLRKDDSANFPWEESPLYLETVMLSDWAVPEKVKLLPIGCTLLKRATFPLAKDRT